MVNRIKEATVIAIIYVMLVMTGCRDQSVLQTGVDVGDLADQKATERILETNSSAEQQLMSAEEASSENDMSNEAVNEISNEKVNEVSNEVDKEPLTPIFENGEAQPVFHYEDAIKEVVWVETDVDTDHDGRADMIKVLIQRPAATKLGMKAAALYEARPYFAGTTNSLDGNFNPYIKDVQYKDAERINSEKKDWHYTAPEKVQLQRHPAAEVSEAGCGTDEWTKWTGVHAYDYWLVRGYAIVMCAGPGTLGSDGFETVASPDETSAFASVVKWLHGDPSVKAYSGRYDGAEVRADWCNGNVAMTGQSYPGSTSFAVATTGVEGLKTIIPRSGIADWYNYYRSQGMIANQLYATGEEPFTLGVYCDSRQFDEEDYAQVKDAFAESMEQMKIDADPLSGGYNAFWDSRNYTNHQEQIKCSAFLVHGLNDFNVKMTHFDKMYNAFKSAGKPVQVVLHQGAHYTPTQIEGLDYNKRLGKWLAHFLYDVDNGADTDTSVLVQSNVDLSWHAYDTWTEAVKEISYPLGQDTAAFSSDLSLTRFDVAKKDEERIEEYSDMAYEWEEDMIEGQKGASVVYSFEVPKDLHLCGRPTVQIRACADQTTGMLSALLVDEAPDGMDAVVYKKHSDAIPTKVTQVGGLIMGDTLEPLDLLQFEQTRVNDKIITRGTMNILFRNGITQAEAVTVGEYYDYTLQLEPTDYEVKAGHKLKVVIFSTDVEMSWWPKKVTNFKVDESQSGLHITVR